MLKYVLSFYWFYTSFYPNLGEIDANYWESEAGLKNPDNHSQYLDEFDYY